LFEMIDELFTDTVVICHHEELFPPSIHYRRLCGHLIRKNEFRMFRKLNNCLFLLQNIRNKALMNCFLKICHCF